MSCKDCKNPQEKVMSNEIPKEKILEQRKRYRAYKKNSLFGSMLFLNPRPDNPFSEKFPEPEIIEHDAGQKSIDETNYQKRNEEYEQNKREQAELKAKFGHLGRNDKCGCGSGVKFKKCCQLKMKP